MHSTTIIFALATATLSFAQSSTISLFIPGADTQSLVASIVGSDATATTYAFQCAPGTESGDCGFPEVVTLTEGPKRAAYTFPPQVDTDGTTAFAGYIDCSLAESSAVCTASAGGTEANFPGLSTGTFTGTDYTSMAVVITAGAMASNRASAPGSTTTSSTSNTVGTSSTASKASGTNSSESQTKTSASQTSSGTGSAAAQNTNSSKTGTSTSSAGGATITGHAAWMVGGAALAVAAMV